MWGIFLVVRSLALLFEGIEFLAEGTHGIMAICHRAVVTSVRRVAEHPWFELVTGLLVLAAGFLFGLIQLLKFAPHLFTSLEVIGEADPAGRKH